MSAAPALWRFWMDTGGTFTDCLAQSPDGGWRRLKVLSSGALRARVVRVEPGNRVVLEGTPAVGDGFFDGWEMRLTSGARGARVRCWCTSAATAEVDVPTFAAGDLVDLSAGEEAPVLAMRILTGTPLAGRLPELELSLATTRGTNALLEGKGATVAFFVTEGFADVLRIGDQRRPDLFAVEVRKPPPLHGPVVEVPERLAADGTVVRPLDLKAVREKAEALVRAGIDVAAVALLHSFRNPRHERAVEEVLRRAGFRFVSVSSELAPLIKIVPRAETAVVDAVLSPVMERYLDGVGKAVAGARFSVMTSAGGLVPRTRFRPKDSLLSGPAGGVAGAAAIARPAGFSRIITFDMGGTSTDVARIDGEFDYRFEHRVGAARVLAPALRVESVAAGGGSICRFDGSALIVGPESAGADPGPACYGAGGPLTLTDVNLLLKRLDPALFGLPVFPDAAEARLADVLASVECATHRPPDRDAVLCGFLEIADERMADAIRRISVREGYDPAEYALVAFGGAGGLHACAVAGRLGISRVLFPADSGLLSALGLREAVPERFAERQMLRPLGEVEASLRQILDEVGAEARARLQADGVAGTDVEIRKLELELRFAGQESGLRIAAEPLDGLAARFGTAYAKRFGYVPTGRSIEVVTVRAVASTARPRGEPETFGALEPAEGAGTLLPLRAVSRAALEEGARLGANTLVQDRFSTLFVADGWKGILGSRGTILLTHVGERGRSAAATGAPVVVDLELFTCRFLALVDEMGTLLQRCALSVNIKERLDFSCALLDPEGELVANAPHIPVHLGAMGECVRRVRAVLELGCGDVAITNHPGFGGSHLPDVTLVAPVHADDGTLLGYVANRAHHAEMGGMRPGSMPPGATRLAQEGVVIAPMHLVRAGSAEWETVRAVLSGGAFPSRAVEENIADLHAQLAAIRRGADALTTLAGQHGSGRVLAYMHRLKERSAEALHAALSNLPGRVMGARDALDDGTPIVVACRRDGDRFVIDFAGSGSVHAGNLNATPAIVRSAVVYVLRLLAGRDLPLNEGLMRDVELCIPQGLLAPDFPADPAACPAVVGGNVETSQRIVDVLMQALGLAACSQGTMNNVIVGNDTFSYYETVAGGTGAGPGFDGCDAVHSHMTNTAITDAEVLELRFPVRLERFAVRRGSGGNGRFRGGDGVERAMLFLAPASLSLLAQRRVAGPPGGSGGLPGAAGRQWIVRADGHLEPLAGVAGAEVKAGDRFVVQTPGGGGWGSVDF